MQPKPSECDSTAFWRLSYRLPWPCHAQVSYSIQSIMVTFSSTKDDVKYISVCHWPSWNGTSMLIAHKEINIFGWPAFLGLDRLVLSWFWLYIDQSDSKYYGNLHDAIYTLCKGTNYNFLVETNGSVAGECEFIVQILKGKILWVGLNSSSECSISCIVSWMGCRSSADGLRLDRRWLWLLECCGALGKEFLVGELADKGMAGWIVILNMA